MNSFYMALIRLLIFGMSLISVFASCTKDDDIHDRAMRLKSLAMTDEHTMPDYTISSFINYYYNSKNQQVAISFDGNQDSISISYGNDGRIHTIIFFLSGVERHNFLAEWTNNQVTLYRRENENSRLVYYFNEDNLVEKVEGLYLEENEWIKFRYDEYQWENGNPVYFESYLLSSKAGNRIRSSDEQPNSIFRDLVNFSESTFKGSLKGATLKKEFSSRTLFDSMKSPYSDSPINRILVFEAWALFSRNNPVQVITDFYSSSGAVYDSDTTGYVYEYNSLSLPARRTTNSEQNLTRTASYNYE